MARRSLRLNAALALVVTALAALAAQRTAAQAYVQDKATLAANEAQQLRGKVAAILRDASAPAAASLKTVDDYFNGYYFPMMTSNNADQLGKLADARKVLFIQYINVAKSQGARDHLIGLTLKAAQKQSIGNYHPAVRYNAALILGQLDQTPAAGNTAPKPLPAATKSLQVLLDLDQVKNVPITSAVKIAALVGLERHTRLGVDAESAPAITKSVLAIANRSEPPADITADVNNWMRCQAAGVLINQSAAGVTPEINDALVNLVGGTELGLDDRCRVAEMLKPTLYAGAQGVDPDAMAMAIGKLAKAVLAEERKKAQEYQDAMVDDPNFGGGGFGGGFGGGRGGRGGFGGGRGGFGGGMTPMEDTGPHYERRRLVDRLMAVHIAAEAVSANGSEELKQRVTQLVEVIKEAADKAANDKTIELEVADLVVELARSVNGIVNGWSADAAPAEEEGAADGDFAGG